MKSIIFVPVKDYFLSRKWVISKFTMPLIAAVVSLIIALTVNVGDSEKIISIFTSFVEVQISVVAILSSFSVAIITFMVSADNPNLQSLKKTPSSEKHYKPVNKKQLSLFQILLSSIAYNVVVEISYLIGLISLSLIQAALPTAYLKYIVALCIFFIVHILLVLLESVSQMYLTFWNSKTE